MKILRWNFRFILLLVPLLVVSALDRAPAGEAPPVNPDSYPRLGEKELGQLKWMLKIADQPLDDFTSLEALDQRGMTSYRYSIAFMTYFMALEQHQKLPACPGIIKPRMDRLISKVITRPVWEFWAEVSQGVRTLEPYMNKPYPEEHDPVADENIMYSGHVGHMIGLYEMLYRDFKWDQPGSIVFEWSPEEKYVYDNHSLNKVMHDQMKNNPWHSIACEPNAVFPECNQHPVLSFMLYDHTHGTNLADVRELFFDFFLERKLIHPESHETAGYYLVKQDLVFAIDSPRSGNALDLIAVPLLSLGSIKMASSSANGWTGAFMHAWKPEYIERHYPYQLDHHLRESKEDTRLKRDYMEPRLQYGFFAMLAAEVGDLETRDKLLEYADRNYDPVWIDGTFHYPLDLSKKCTNLTGKLVAIARANPGRAMWNMHNRPFDDSHFKEPTVEGVDLDKVSLVRAVYDRERKALVITLEPGKEPRAEIRITRLDPSQRYRLWTDGKPGREYRGKKEIELELSVEKKRDLVLAAY